MRVVLALLVLLSAGCVDAVRPAGVALGEGATLRVLDADGAPVAYAAVTFLAAGAPVGVATTDANGAATAPAAADEVVVSATGYLLARARPSGDVVLERGEAAAEAADATPVLRVLPRHDFGVVYLGPEVLCERQNTCGLSEPVVEVAGDGTIYASSTCCVGKAPPVWASRDGGATWKELTTPGVREATGIEGDFAVDDAGNVYFTDILLGAMWLTSWDKDGAWRHTVPVPLAPLVDRPWVRAGAEDVVYFLYNTGRSTELHVSTDGGQTFPPVPLHSFPAPLGTLGQGPERDHLWVVARGVLYESTDGGATWSDGEDVPMPEDAKDGESGWNFHVPVVDESGRVLVGADVGSADTGYRVYAALRETDGTGSTTLVSPAGGTHYMPWPAAGKDGGFVLAWYGTDDAAADPNDVPAEAEWYAFLASSRDAGRTWQVVRADPEPVALGPMDRRLLDFLQVDLAPDGAAHLVYANNLDGSRAERTLYVRTTVGLGLAPLAYPNGPKAEPAASGSLLPLRIE